MTRKQAIKAATRLAKEGPRIAAVVKQMRAEKYMALPGFVASIDAPEFVKIWEQIALVDPDGHVWVKA